MWNGHATSRKIPRGRKGPGGRVKTGGNGGVRDTSSKKLNREKTNEGPNSSKKEANKTNKTGVETSKYKATW